MCEGFESVSHNKSKFLAVIHIKSIIVYSKYNTMRVSKTKAAVWLLLNGIIFLTDIIMAEQHPATADEGMYTNFAFFLYILF